MASSHLQRLWLLNRIRAVRALAVAGTLWCRSECTAKNAHGSASLAVRDVGEPEAATVSRTSHELPFG